MNHLKDKIVLITGAGKGMGRALALALAERGAIIAANDISPVNVDLAIAEIIAHGGQAKAYIEDIAKKVGAQYLVNSVEEDFGRIDILIHHAAVEPHTPLLQMDEWDWHRTLDVNLTGAFLMMQSAARIMRSQGSGKILSIISESSRNKNQPMAAYLASMAGLTALSQQAGLELQPLGIRVHAVQNLEEALSLLETA
jgi:3-oxoacyl-[acyl-carrier protein] reductase